MFTTTYSRAGVQFLFCAVISIFLGFLWDGVYIFQPGMPSFQFVTSGLFVGLIVASRHFLSLPRTAFVAAVIYLLYLWVNKIEDSDKRASLAVYFGVLYAGTVGGLLCDRIFPRLAVGKFVIWAVLFGVLHLGSPPFLAWALSQPLYPGLAMYTGRMGAMIGLATGFGYEMAVLAGAGVQADEKAPRGALEE